MGQDLDAKKGGWGRHKVFSQNLYCNIAFYKIHKIHVAKLEKALKSMIVRKIINTLLFS